MSQLATRALPLISSILLSVLMSLGTFHGLTHTGEAQLNTVGYSFPLSEDMSLRLV